MYVKNIKYVNKIFCYLNLLIIDMAFFIACLPCGDAGPRVHGEPRHLALRQCVPVADALRALPAAERAGGGFRA